MPRQSTIRRSRSTTSRGWASPRRRRCATGWAMRRSDSGDPTAGPFRRAVASFGHHLAGTAKLLRKILELGHSVLHMQCGLLIVDVHPRPELQSREDRRIHVREAQSGMLAEDMSAAGLAPLAGTIRSLVIRADVVRAASDAQSVRLPQRESVHGTRRPVSARLAMAIAHRGRLTGHDELDGSAKT